MKTFLSWLPERIRWVPHNLVSHPLSELVYLFTGNSDGLSGWIHDITVPHHKDGQGRG